MITIYNRNTDPYFNLAAEEYLLENSNDDIFMLWRNAPSVIIGKNQNTWAEIDTEYVEKNSITVARRITGGGAVFHDLGNINYSFITGDDDASRLNFGKFTSPIIKALLKMGIDAALDGRNDIVAEGFKISGNAQCVITAKDEKKRLLHHGTLLFDADMTCLSSALKVSKKKIQSKGIKSVKSRVKNILDFDSYSGPDTAEEFIKNLLEEVGGDTVFDFSEAEKTKISKKRNEKFALWDWNWGASPVFDLTMEERFPFGTLTAMVNCRMGKIEKIKFYGDYFSKGDVFFAENTLTGCPFEKNAVFRRLEDIKEELFISISGATPEDICNLLFKGESNE